MPRVIGIDPASTRTGYAVLDDGNLVLCGCLVTRRAVAQRPEDKRWCRAHRLRCRLAKLVRKMEPDAIGIEVNPPATYKGRKASVANMITFNRAMAMAVAGLASAADSLRKPCPVIQVDVQDWCPRKGKTKNEVKAQTMAMASHLYGEPLTLNRGGDTDKADAIMIAHSVHVALIMAKRSGLDIEAYVRRAWKNSEVWLPYMLADRDDKWDA